jgi:chemosensory pili system protein ChpC
MTVAEADIRGVLIPLDGYKLLLPNVTIAEVVGFREPSPYPQTPDWLLGEIQWHGRKFPLVSFERALNVPTAPPGARARIVVCNTLGEDPRGLPYIGVVAKAIPRLVGLIPASISPNLVASEASPLVLRQVYVAGQEAIIPDLDALEETIIESLALTSDKAG